MTDSAEHDGWSPAAVARLRLHHQRLGGLRCTDPAEVVRWLGAAQAQDYYGAKWSMAQRCPALTNAEFEAAFARGDFLRTHVLRPTWHFVAPEDLRWLQRLTGPRVQAVNASMHRKLGIDGRLLRRSRSLLVRALEKATHQTREELAAALARGGITTRGPHLAYLVMHAELEGLICSGPRRGLQFTYALVDERVDRSRDLAGDEALAELARRYFQSHGPATERDFARWSGLTLATARRGVAVHAADFASRNVDGETWWFLPSQATIAIRFPVAHLLSIYDELLIGYGDHRWAAEATVRKRLRNVANSMTQLVVVNGLIAGRWKKVESRGKVRVECALERSLSAPERAALREAVKAFVAFHAA